MYVVVRSLFARLQLVGRGSRGLLEAAIMLTSRVEWLPASLLNSKSIAKVCHAEPRITRSRGNKCEVGEPATIICNKHREIKP